MIPKDFSPTVYIQESYPLKSDKTDLISLLQRKDVFAHWNSASDLIITN